MKRLLTNTTFFDGYTTTGESDTTVLLDYTGAGGWNVLPDFAPTDAAQAQRDKDEYICKCGLRVTPHRCKTGEEF